MYRITFRLHLLVCAVLGATMYAGTMQAQSEDSMDPSGAWRSPSGVLSLMLADDVLVFSYSSVFGEAVHLCDGAGAAKRVSANVYHYVDAEGTVAFIIDRTGVRMMSTDGIPSFCGSGWPGEQFMRKDFLPPTCCNVSATRSHFYRMAPSTPTRRKAYVVLGDRVEVLPAQHEGSNTFVLARYIGSKAATVGLLKASTLRCPQ